LTNDNGPFALAAEGVLGRELKVFRHGSRTLADIYRKAQARNSVFLIGDGQAVSYRALFQRAANHAASLSGKGIRPGMRIALSVSDDLDWIASFVAVTSLGAVAVLVPGLIDCDDAITDGMASNGGESQLRYNEIHPDSDACIAFTSGSSGAPKGVILTHRALITGVMNMMLVGAVAARGEAKTRSALAKPVAPTVLLRSPLNHVSGYMQVLSMLLMGGRILRSRRPDFAALLAEHHVTSVIGLTDTDATALVELPTGMRIERLRSVAVAGRSLPAPLRRALRERWPGLGIGNGYGLTETCGLISAVGNREFDVRPNAVGRLSPVAECRIVGLDGHEAPAGKIGDIWLRGAMLMRDYCNVHDHAMPEGWFATGDVGFLAQDGMLHVIDRRDRFLRIGYQRTSCSEIEDALRRLGRLTEVAALPVTKRGGDDSLLVVLAHSDVKGAPLRDLLVRHFPSVRDPRFVRRPHLPRTGSGKIAYAQLLAEFGS